MTKKITKLTGLSGRGCLWRTLQKFCIITKLSILLLILSIAQVSGKVFGQITLHQQNTPMIKVLRLIEKQSGYVFVFNEDKIKFGNVNIDVNNASIKETLDICFKSTNITYQIINKNVVLHKKGDVLPDKKTEAAYYTPMIITGRVTNAQRQPLVGATVLIRRSKTGVTTDYQGLYMLKMVETSDTLLVSYLGYQTRAIPLGTRIIDNPRVDVTLFETTNQMDEVVIQGYGNTSRRLATGNITRVSGEELAKQPVMNPLLALQGKVAGVIITPVDGSASGPVKVEIRGRKALNREFPSDPLYIINGVPLTIMEVRGATASGDGSTAYSRGFDQSGLTPGQSPFFSINPEDIESIEVLKDADATAIYGSRGANGVILISTKRGKAGKTKINLGVNGGVNYVTRYFDMLNTEQYLAMRKEAFFNAGVTPIAANAYDLITFDQTRYTDWQRYMKGASSQKNFQANISGGSELTTYRLGGSLGITNDMNTISGKNKRGTASFSLHNQTANQRLSMDFDASYSMVYVDATTMNRIIALPPNAPDPFDEQGNLNYAGWGAAYQSFPFSELKNTRVQSGNTLSSSLGFTYNIAKGLSASVRGGYNNTTNLVTYLTPIAGRNPFTPEKKYGTAQFGTTRSNSVIVEPQLNYSALINKGTLSILAGTTYQEGKTTGAKVTGSNYTDDALLGTISNAPIVTADDIFAVYKYAGIYARANFVWDGKYIINLNGRRDGSSRFGRNSRYGNFYSIGAAWNLSDEQWIKKMLPGAISLIKIRGSYGITGSDGVGDYKYLTQYGNTRQGDYNGVSPIMPQIQPNEDYHWQVNKSTELSLDLGFLNDRLNFNVSAYRSYCNNQLIDFLTPDFTGFSSVVANSPAEVVNDGIELQLSGSVIKNKNFSWTISLNTGFNRNRLLSYPNLSKSPYASTYKLGSSVSTTYLLNYTGIDPLTGDYTFEDHDKNNKIEIVNGPEARGDKYIGVKIVPDYTGNMTQSFSYKGFSLTASFYMVKQMGKSFLSTINAGANTNIPTERYDTRWQKPGDQALAPKVSVSSSSYFAYISSSTEGYTDASFIRLNALHVSGSLPASLARKLGVAHIGLSVSASNIFVITNYKGLDPVVQNFGGTLPSRTISFGLNTTF